MKAIGISIQNEKHFAIFDDLLRKSANILRHYMYVFSYRWKQLSEYEFTASSFDARVVTNIILQLIVKCKEIGLKVRVLVMDMGPCNKAI